MPESLESFAELNAIRMRLEGIESKQEMLVRAQAPQILSAIWALVDKDHLLGQVFLAANGNRTQQEIVDYLRSSGVSASQPTVSRKLDRLMSEMGLIELGVRKPSGATYRKSSLDRILHLTPKVEKRLGKVDRGVEGRLEEAQ